MTIFCPITIYNRGPRTDRHKLAGTTSIDGVPTKRLIAVINRVTLGLVAVTISDSITGAWELSGLFEYPEETLLIISIDINKETNAVVADLISQVAG